MTAAPSGVVTFLFTDVEGSTGRWESDAQAMRAALVVHDKVLRTVIEAYDGFLFSHTGDGVVAAFGLANVRRECRERRGTGGSGSGSDWIGNGRGGAARRG